MLLTLCVGDLLGNIQLLPDFSSTSSVADFFISAGAHAAVFLLSFFILRYFIFNPALKIFRLRKESIDEVERKAKEIIERDRVVKEEYQWRMDGALQLAEEKKDIALLMGKRRADMILVDVRRETHRDMDNLTKKADEVFEAVLPTIKDDIEKFGRYISDKVLSH